MRYYLGTGTSIHTAFFPRMPCPMLSLQDVPATAHHHHHYHSVTPIFGCALPRLACVSRCTLVKCGREGDSRHKGSHGMVQDWAGRLRHWLSAQLRARRYPLVAAGIILAAAVVRVGLLAVGWPGTDSDDATMGLMAKHILTRGEHPIFFYGQSYIGTIEAYLGALMFALFGVSQLALKCGLVVRYAGFMVVMYALLTQLVNRRWALVGLTLLAFGGDDMLYHQLEAYGGYLETLFFGAL